MACFRQPRNECLQRNLGLFCPKRRTAAPQDNSYTEMEYHAQGQVVFNSWTSIVQKGRAAAGSSGQDGAKTACETPEKEDRQA